MRRCEKFDYDFDSFIVYGRTKWENNCFNERTENGD